MNTNTTRRAHRAASALYLQPGAATFERIAVPSWQVPSRTPARAPKPVTFSDVLRDLLGL